MKNIIKYFTICLVFAMIAMPSFAGIFKDRGSSFENLINGSSLNKTATIAVSVKEVKSGNVVYQHNQNKLLNPASTWKLFSAPAAIDALGADYVFKTQLFVDKYRNVYIKLGADPFLTAKDLKTLVKSLRVNDLKKINNIYIDDSILDKMELGTGWMWDDDLNPYMPRFSAYNLDNNVFKINVSKCANGSIGAKVQNMYPVAIINNLKSSSTTKYSMNRYNWNSPDVVELNGTIANSKVITVPINNMRRYFTYRLTDYLNRYNIKRTSDNYRSVLVPKNAKLISEVSHNVGSAVPAVLKNSDNRIAETICKVAAGKVNKSTGTATLEVKLIKDFYASQGLDTSNIVIADASGVSRNDLVTVDWMTTSLDKFYSMKSFEYLKSNMAQPGEGTLRNRFFDLRGNLWLKTGTLSNISGLTGYVKAKNGKLYSVAILLQNFNVPQIEAKKLENSIINQIYQL